MIKEGLPLRFHHGRPRCDNWGCEFALFDADGRSVRFYIRRGLIEDLHERWRDRRSKIHLLDMFDDNSADICLAANVVFERRPAESAALFEVDAEALHAVGALNRATSDRPSDLKR